VRTALGFSIVLAALSTIGCGPARVRLPTGAGTPAADFETTLKTALNRCGEIQTFSAELALSGHARSQPIRGHVIAGFAPAALRLEAVAPSGTPAFILVANGSGARLLLPRDHRLVEGARAAEILEALVGIALGPDDLRGLLSGCLKATVAGAAARAYGTDWLVVELTGGGDLYLHRTADHAWRPVAGHVEGLMVEYSELGTEVPGHVRIRSVSGSRAEVDLSIGLSQVDVNGDLPPDKLVALSVPPATSPMSLEELKRQGPFGR
jgi:hypothetical protein